MTLPRSQLVSLDATPYYHCITRCVRRAFLCGVDRYSGKSFDHRKPWLVERLKLLSEVYAIDIAAYAVMSNHYHVVLHVDMERAQHWSTDEVIHHWKRIFTGPKLVQRYVDGVTLSKAELKTLHKVVAKWRERLTSISWFMRCMNEYLARKSNLEDNCKGRFWEARFKSQALLDETALLSCMAYVDLNPVRAGIANTLDDSDFTSIQDRLRQVRMQSTPKAKSKDEQQIIKPRLMPFSEVQRQDQTYSVIPFNLKDYIALVDWTGRSIRPDKRGYIDNAQPVLLSTLGLSEQQWRVLALDIQKQAITMLNGLNTLARIEKRAKLTNAA